MPPTTEEAIKTYHQVSKKGSPRGRSAEYISLKNGWGIKIFDNEGRRNRNWARQKLAAEYGLGPEVGDRLNIGNRFAFITEEVETLIKFSGVSNPSNPSFCEAIQGFNDDSKYYDTLNELVNELQEKIGWYFADCHTANIGIKNNRYICIDFG